MIGPSYVKKIYKIVDESSGGDLRFVLMVEGEPAAAAGASSHVVSQMEGSLGVTREDVVSDLKGALESFHSNELDKVTIGRLQG